VAISPVLVVILVVTPAIAVVLVAIPAVLVAMLVTFVAIPAVLVAMLVTFVAMPVALVAILAVLTAVCGSTPPPAMAAILPLASVVRICTRPACAAVEAAEVTPAIVTVLVFVPRTI